MLYASAASLNFSSAFLSCGFLSGMILQGQFSIGAFYLLIRRLLGNPKDFVIIAFVIQYSILMVTILILSSYILQGGLEQSIQFCFRTAWVSSCPPSAVSSPSPEALEHGRRQLHGSPFELCQQVSSIDCRFPLPKGFWLFASILNHFLLGTVKETAEIRNSSGIRPTFAR